MSKINIPELKPLLNSRQASLIMHLVNDASDDLEEIRNIITLLIE